MNRIAIHGFGRIGRTATRVALKNGLFTPFSISDIKDLSTLTVLFTVDTNYGLWPEEVKNDSEKIIIGNKEILFFDTSKSLPNWASLGVDIVIDCTARATIRSGAQAHLDQGAKKVLISAASKTSQDCDAVLLPGINMDSYDPSKHHIISMASCTTNALAPLIKVLRDNFGIQSGFFSTVHAYTNTQSLTDQPMKDRRDSWSAAENIIPSSSGAAKALKFIWPDLNVTGKAYRIPVSTGSIVELNAILKKNIETEEVKNIFREAANTPPLKGIMGILEDEFASSRIVGESLSSIVDLPLLQVIDGRMLSIAAWYDNETGYATRLVETAQKLAG